MTYSPWRAVAAMPDILVFRERLPSGSGWWVPSERVIFLDAQLDRIGRRCTLAHELEHVRAGDHGCYDDYFVAHRIERWANRRAARRLISLESLVDGLRWANDDHQLAEELDVDHDTLRCRADCLTEDERAYLDRTVAEEWIA